MASVNEILLRRKNKVLICDNTEKMSILQSYDIKIKLVTSIVKNIESLGFTFSKDLFSLFMKYSEDKIKEIYFDLFGKLKKLVGADKEYNVMYPNFPQQIAEIDDVELFVNQILHYWSCGSWLPSYSKDERLPLLDNVKFKVLDVGTKADLIDVFKNLISSKTNLSVQDKDDIEKIADGNKNFYKYIPDTIPLKENVALVGKLYIEKIAIKDYLEIAKYFKTATDVLRLVVALSNGDISLANKTRFKKLKRYERRIVMNLLANCNNIYEDIYHYKNEWIRIGEIVHPFEYTSVKYKNVVKAFQMIRNDKNPLFDRGRVQIAIDTGDTHLACNILKKHAGEFARQLDKLLRTAKNEKEQEYIIDCFDGVACDVSTQVLWQVRNHFENRSKSIEDNSMRVFFPKGNLAKVYSIPNELKQINENVCEAIVRICSDALIKRYGERDPMGNVYIDEKMKNFLIPFSQRSASSSNKAIVRGSRITLNNDTKVVRAFIWWTNTKNRGESLDDGRVDIDLSATLYDENLKYLQHISYTNLRDDELSAYHSGDITYGGDKDGKGVAEFIDIDIEKAAKFGRYIVFQVYSYTRQKFKDLPNCRFGWMQRECENSGEIFEPSTVDAVIDINSDNTAVIPVIFDCKEKVFIWYDMSLNLGTIGINNLENNMNSATAICYSMLNLSKPNLYSLISLNAIARGKIVSNRDEADIIFSNDPTFKATLFNIDKDENPKDDNIREVKAITAYDIDYFYNMI